jgi:phosphoenolpyruvate carboxylase
MSSHLNKKLSEVLGQRQQELRYIESDAIKLLFENLVQGNGTKMPFEQFKGMLEQELTGLVITAHPTFMHTQSVWNTLKAKDGDDLSETSPSEQEGLYPTKPPSLTEELEMANEALKSIRQAIRKIVEIAIAVAAQQYPEQYKTLTPKPMTVATWVGFDLDGRTDIGWESSLSIRYQLALEGVKELKSLLNSMEWPKGHGLEQNQIAQSLDLFQECFALGEDLLRDGDVAALNRAAMQRREAKDQAIAQINQAFESVLERAIPMGFASKLLLLRSEFQNLGLGLSHIHFRLNAVQLHNAIRSEIKLDRSPDSSASRRHYLAAITKLLDKVAPLNVHYGNLASEATTAKRLFMMAAQFEKHFDRHTPIRLLIAESDTPFTVLTALYFAKLFDVDDHVEISPLFETAIGLQRGDRVIADLLENSHFVDYIRKQGRFCVQLGFSDSGRYIGQPAATLAIERFKLRLIQLWQREGLSDVQLVFFDTHGESIGRGAHPKSLEDRFLYTQSRRVRAALAGLEVPAKHEVSFQGGDGYLWFLDEDRAFSVAAELLLVQLNSDHGSQRSPDPFYEDSGWSLDFFLTLTDYHDHLSDHPGYKALLGSFGPNLLFPTGSRAAKRQSVSSSAQGLESISSLRAIPHNAILQQLGYMANTLAGIGRAIERSPDKFVKMVEDSTRLQRIMGLVLGANARSEISTLKAYVDLMSPGAWLAIADAETDPIARDQARRLSRILEKAFDHGAMSELVRMLGRDAGLLKDALRDHPILHKLGAESDTELTGLHRVRQAQIKLIYLKAMEVPRFSTRLDVSVEDLVAGLLRLEIPETLAALRKIFPLALPEKDTEDYGEKSSYKARTRGYVHEHEHIFDPIEEAYGRVLSLSANIAGRIGAFG